MSRRFDIPLRWGDLDAQAHLNNVVTVELMQEARAAFFLDSPLSVMLSSGVVVADHRVEYLKAVEHSPEPLQIDVAVTDVRGAGFVVAYLLHHDGALVTRASSTLCPFDFATDRVRRLKDDERTFLAEAREDVEVPAPLEVVPVPESAHASAATVRWSDIDQYRHVNNVHYLDYIQQSRITLLEEAMPGVMRMGHPDAPLSWLIARQDIQYRKPLHYRAEPYTVRHAVAKVGTTSATLAAEIVDSDGTVHATSQQVLVCANSHGPAPIPDRLRRGMTPHLLETAGA